MLRVLNLLPKLCDTTSGVCIWKEKIIAFRQLRGTGAKNTVHTHIVSVRSIVHREYAHS